ncbi:major capsid protein [Rummeliibacillus stabekisii]|uniref:major capsid protein n=1 Tax=Rummeliibacillus stabekisii TaxID=241244 RepID=UPI0037131A96
MAGLTIAQSAELTQDELQRGVIETMATESKLLAILPFMNVEGHGYSYNVEKSLAGVEFRDVNTAYNTEAPETERRTEFLTILGGEAIVDSFQVEVHSNVNDLMAVETALTAKSIGHKYEKTFLNGDSAKKSTEFDGLIKRAAALETTVTASADIVDDIDVLLDSVQGGADALIMNKKTRRALTKAARDNIEFKVNEFGVQVAYFGGVPIVDVEAEILADEYILAVKFGVHEAVAGLQSKSGVMVKPLGELGSTPQLKTRIEWFCGLAVFNDNTIAMRKPAEAA